MRIVLDADKVLLGLQIRGMGLVELAAVAQISPATASAAVSGKTINLSTAMRVAQAMASRPIIGDLRAIMNAGGSAEE